jgi:hypothetical protein
MTWYRLPAFSVAMGRAVVCAVALLPPAQQVPPAKPVFKGEVTVVEVDVVARRKSGELVRGLRQEDFEVLEDGAPVSIAFLPVELPDVPLQPTIAPANRSGSAFASNDQPDDGRLVLIVLDDVQLDFTQRRVAMAKAIARRAVERLGPADQAGVMTTTGGGQAEFTSDKGWLIEAIERFGARGENALPDAARSMPLGQEGDALPKVATVLPLTPFASNELAPGTQAAAQLPISVAEKAASQPLTIVATLTAPDGTTRPLDRTVGVGREYASRGGRVHKVLLPPALGAGPHRLVVESTLGRTTVVRELTLNVLPLP